MFFSYEPVRANIIRNFQKQSITREDPQVYLNRYGSQLYDANLVVQQARAIGVVEDLVSSFCWSVNKYLLIFRVHHQLSLRQ